MLDIPVPPSRLLRWGAAVAVTMMALAAVPGAALAAPTTTSLPSLADASVEQPSPDQNYGSSSTLRIDAQMTSVSPASGTRGYLRFKAPPAGAVTSAKLRLYVTDHSDAVPAAYAIGAPWSESVVDWNNRPASPSTPTTATPGGAAAVGTWLTWDVTSAVKAGVLSFALVPRSTNGLSLSSREAANKPQLVVITDAATATPTPTPTATPAPTTTPAPTPTATPAPTTTPAPTPAPTPTATPAPTPTPAPAPTSGVLFSDDFGGASGAAPDAAKWVDYCFPGWGKIRCGADEKLDGQGHLVLNATPSWGSGLQSRGKAAFRYGTFSAWMKMPPQGGYWPGWWLLNGAQENGQTTAEIDINETYTQWNTLSNSAIHIWNSWSEAWKQDILCKPGANLSAAFHKFSARWEPTRVTFLVDDVVCSTVDKGTHSPWPLGPDAAGTPPRPAWMLLDLAVGGAGQAAPSANAQLLIDRVEVKPL